MFLEALNCVWNNASSFTQRKVQKSNTQVSFWVFITTLLMELFKLFFSRDAYNKHQTSFSRIQIVCFHCHEITEIRKISLCLNVKK